MQLETGTGKPFLHRAYEIALFSEKYSGKIDLETIEADLRRQKLRAIFGRMIFDIAEIFPEAFPDSFDKYPGLII